MSNRPAPDPPPPGEGDRTFVDKPTKPNPENEETFKLSPSSEEMALAEGFFANLVVEKTQAPAARPLTSRPRTPGRPATSRRKAGVRKRVPDWVWIACGSGVGVLLLLGIMIAIAANSGSDDEARLAASAGDNAADVRDEGSSRQPRARATRPAPDATGASGSTTSSPTNETPASPPGTNGWHGWPADAPAPAMAPFDAQKAQAHQGAWAKHLGVPVEHENSIGMKLKLIPPGEFLVGSTPEEIEAALEVVGEDEVWRQTDCGTCTATCGSGCRTAGIRRSMGSPERTPQSTRSAHSPPAPSECSAAANGPAVRIAVVQRIASPIIR